MKTVMSLAAGVVLAAACAAWAEGPSARAERASQGRQAVESVAGVPIESGASAKPGAGSTGLFAALKYACHGGKTRIIAKNDCRSERDWANIAQKICAKSCVKIPLPGGGVRVKCGVNTFQTLKPCQ